MVFLIHTTFMLLSFKWQASITCDIESEWQTNDRLTVVPLFCASYKEITITSNLRVAGSIPDRVIDITFRRLNLEQKWVPGIFSDEGGGGKGGRCLGLINLPLSCADFLDVYNLKLVESNWLVICLKRDCFKSNETPTWCNTVQVLFLQSHSTCFGRKRPSSGVIRRCDTYLQR